MHRRARVALALSLVSTAAFVACGGAEKPAQPPPQPVCPQPPASALPIAVSSAQQPTAEPGTPDEGDGGMWLLNDFPAEKVEKKYGFKPSKEWLDHVRLSSVRLAFGCSGSIVSPDGLVMTNHHCAEHCIQQLSSAKKDFVASGFYAKTEKEEVKCPEMEINQLTDITDVTDRVNAATKGLEGKAFHEAQKGVMSTLEKECATSDKVRCDVVTLYQGGKYHLYKYRRFQDVRLAFAPEFAIAFFGGDPDNFNFPRYDLDVSFLRLYEDGKPVDTKATHFNWSKAGAKEGELTFVSGHPGRTSRLLTISQLQFERDVTQPEVLMRYSELRGVLEEFAAKGKEQRRISGGDLFGVENSIKARKGREEALLDPQFFAEKVGEEKALRAKVEANPDLRQTAGGAWDAIAEVQKKKAALYLPMLFLERGAGFRSHLFDIARDILRSTEELTKPNEKRLREYADSQMPAMKVRMFSAAPIYDDFEVLTLTWSLTKLREELGADDPIVKKILGKESPAEVATRLVKGTKLKDVAARKKLFDGGKAAVDASNDAMIAFAKLVDPDARAVRAKWEDDVEAVERKNQEAIAKARFAIYGTSVYPDATFTLRLSYGHVEGWVEPNGTKVPAFTTFGGAFDRATGRDPFKLPESWLKAKAKLDLSTPFDFVTTNDIIGGNSGSPMINKDAEIVGLIFDGNIHSLGGEYGFDPRTNRAVAVDSLALTEALSKVYGADRIVGDLKR